MNTDTIVTFRGLEIVNKHLTNRAQFLTKKGALMRDRAERIHVRIVKEFRRLRKLRALSHAALARRTGITRAAISHVENGRRNLSLLVCVRLARGLDTDLSEVLKAVEARCPRTYDCSRCQYAHCCP